MSPETLHARLSIVYQEYNRVIKPLLADIEARYQKFPDSLFNEIRALNDHVSRCYVTGITDEKIIREIEKAEGHAVRISLDCYKYLDVWFYDFFEKFDKNYTCKIDLTLIDQGELAISYRKFQSNATATIRKAKESESMINKKVLNYTRKHTGFIPTWKNSSEITCKNSNGQKRKKERPAYPEQYYGLPLSLFPAL
jgi:hypothetical protein